MKTKTHSVAKSVAAAALVALMCAPGCVTERRLAATADTSAVDALEDSATSDNWARDATDTLADATLGDAADGLDAGDVADTEQRDTTVVPDTDPPADTRPLDAGDTTPPQDTVVITPPCLPTGCTEPDLAGCGLADGWCFIDRACVADGDARPEQPCEVCDAAAHKTGWTSRADATACDDGLSCTAEDRCVDGRCAGTTDCTAQANCLTPVCDPDAAPGGACAQTVDRDRCYIGGRCYVTGHTATVCRRCKPEHSQVDWSPFDANEPSDSVGQAVDLGAFDAHASGGVVQWSEPRGASLGVALDVDHYRFVYPTSLGFNRPTVQVTAAEPGATSPWRICVYLRCLATDEGGPTFASVGCGGGDKVTTPDGHFVGCCTNTTADSAREFTPSNAWCTDSQGHAVATDAEALISIAWSAPQSVAECMPYTVAWGLR